MRYLFAVMLAMFAVTFTRADDNQVEQITADQRCVNGVCYNRMSVADGAVTLHVAPAKTVQTVQSTTVSTSYRFPVLHRCRERAKAFASHARGVVRYAVCR